MSLSPSYSSREYRPSIAARSLARTAVPAKEMNSRFKNILAESKYKGVCKSCKEKRYDFALHIVKLDREGRCIEPRLLPDWDNFERPEMSGPNKSLSRFSPKGKSVISLSDSTTSLGQTLSSSNLSLEKFYRDFVFNPKFAANFFLEKIREFNQKKGSHRDNRGLMDAIHERPEFMSNLEQLCREVERILVQEDRCVEISAPAFCHR